MLSGVLSMAEGAEISPFWTNAKELWSLGKAPSKGVSVGGAMEVSYLQEVTLEVGRGPHSAIGWSLLLQGCR